MDVGTNGLERCLHLRQFIGGNQIVEQQQRADDRVFSGTLDKLAVSVSAQESDQSVQALTVDGINRLQQVKDFFLQIRQGQRLELLHQGIEVLSSGLKFRLG